MTGGNGGRYGGPLYDGEPIEPELLAIARRLDHDGGTWRRELPDERRVAQRVIAALSSAAPTALAPAPNARTRPNEQGMPSQPGGPRRSNQPRRQRGAQRLLAVAAMLMVVILLAALLKALASGQVGPHPTATATATAARSATSTPVFPGAWSVAGTVTLQAPPVFAPSDPRVAYEAAVQMPGAPGRGGPTTTSLILQRTDDAGKTWHTLPLPAGLVVDDRLFDLHLVVSVFDAHTVFLYSARSAANCTPQGDPSIHALSLAPQLSRGSGGVCLTQYRSGDGGASWTRLTLPVPGIIAQVVYDGNGTVYALVAQPQYGAGGAAPPIAWSRAPTSAKLGTWPMHRCGRRAMASPA